MSGFDDQWALKFFRSMLDETLTREQFELAVDAHAMQKNMVISAPGAATWVYDISCSYGFDHDAGYGREQARLQFGSQWLVGKHGKPGGVHIHAPAEAHESPGLDQLNRTPHCHDTSRIGLITSGQATFIFLVEIDSGGLLAVHCPVRKGDMVFWPARTPHTFNAEKGFSLLSAMPEYVSPENDGFSLETGYGADELRTAIPVPMDDYFR